MWLSWRQWVLLAVLDVFLRYAYFFVVFYAAPIFIRIAIFFSTLRLVVLFVAIVLAVRLGRATFKSIVAAVVITNVIYVGAFFSFELVSIKEVSATSCSGLELSCDWIDGVVQWRGVLRLAIFALPQVLINIAAFTTMSGFKRFGNRSAP
jgi:hypothetical protein